MPQLIRSRDNGNAPIVADGSILRLIHFNRVRLAPGETFEQRLPAHEAVAVVQSGTVDMTVEGERFEAVGGRADVWSGPADSVYVPLGASLRIENRSAAPAEIAIAGGVTDERHPPFRVRPSEVSMVDVGSRETHSHRRIFHILGQNAQGRAGHLLVSELYADDGCWSGYPPHKHDEDRGEDETAHEELYHYRFRPETGFGVQIAYADGQEQCFVTRSGDTFLLDRGYHPTVTSPGHQSYIFTILVGKSRRGLVQFFEPRHAHLMSQIPGIALMRDKFR